ncbi:hypothetical protein [Nocardia brasiliensis]|uniref:hypothetical protein n=1 Tax=Nocardia brasiliensis TaxID=37326 RepID=UPI002455AAD4|nr:hypothetical protein [Nocardia brasiliensis]
MTLEPDCHLAYIIWNEAWFYIDDGDPSRIQVQAASSYGGVDWEFAIEEGGLRTQPSTRIRMFDDAYKAVVQVPELFAALAAEEPRHLEEVVKILNRLGAIDATKRESPYDDRSRTA